MMLFLFFLGFFLLIVSLIIFMTLKIKIKEFKTSNEKSSKVEMNIMLNLYLFRIIKIFSLKIDEKRIKKIKNNSFMQKFDLVSFENKSIFKNLKEIINNSFIRLEELKLKLYIGTESILITIFLVPIISSILSAILAKTYNKKNNYEYRIIPLYKNENKYNLDLSCIISIKIIHIIYIIYIFLKRSVNKNERTSNRGNYEYCNGQYKKYDRCKYHYRRAN